MTRSQDSRRRTSISSCSPSGCATVTVRVSVLGARPALDAVTVTLHSPGSRLRSSEKLPLGGTVRSTVGADGPDTPGEPLGPGSGVCGSSGEGNGSAPGSPRYLGTIVSRVALVEPLTVTGPLVTVEPSSGPRTVSDICAGGAALGEASGDEEGSGTVTMTLIGSDSRVV